MKNLVIIISCAAISCDVAEAETLSGNHLFDACSFSEGTAPEGFCVGYTVGVVEGLIWGAASILQQDTGNTLQSDDLNTLANILLGICIPAGATNGQIRDVIVKYLREHPETRHNSARTLVSNALMTNFPCS